MKTFAERLTFFMEKNNLNQRQLADILNIRRPSISDWKQKGVLPSVEISIKLAKLFNTSVEYLITGNEENPLEEENKRLKEKLSQIEKMAKLH